MVRFSDIINIRDNKKKKEKPAPDKIVHAKKLWLSDTQMYRIEKERGSPDSFLSENANLEVITYYEKFLERAIEIRDRVKKDRGISPSPILSDLHYIIDNHLINDLYIYAMSAPDNDEEMLVHTADVTFASLQVGEGMRFDTKQLLELGLAGFLENVGMYKISDSILKKAGKLDEREIGILRRHPGISSQILSRMGSRYGWLADVALQIHERADGSGYPRGLKGEDISELASIIGLIDIYVALIKKRPYRDKLVQTDAIKFIIKEAKGLFPAKILKAFLNQISLFPVNTYVKLNNKSTGRVIATDKNQPLRPVIELLYDGQGRKLAKKEVIRLDENPLLYIVNGLDEKKLG